MKCLLGCSCSDMKIYFDKKIVWREYPNKNLKITGNKRHIDNHYDAK